MSLYKTKTFNTQTMLLNSIRRYTPLVYLGC